MTLTINLTPELELKLRQAAAEAGVGLDSLIIRSVEEHLGNRPRSGQISQRLPPKESELLLKINGLLASFDWERYRELIANREGESLTPDEYSEIAALSDKIEAAGAQRMTLVAELAHLRKTSVPALMAELDRPHE